MKKTILIVEDESIVAQDLQEILEDLGYHAPEIADCGELAIEKAGRLNPSLILMDIRLIGAIDGITAAEIIQEKYDIPIVYLTAHSDAKTLERAKYSCPFGYILKPFQERELHTTIEISLYKHQMQKQLKQHNLWLAAVLESISDGVITTDTENNITYMNPTAENITGWSFQEAIGENIQKVFRVIYEKNRQIVNIPIQQIRQTGKTLTLLEQIILVKKNGKELPIEDSISPIYNISNMSNNLDFQKTTDDNFLGTVYVFRDITQQKSIIKQLHRQAFYDDLTNLANRAWFRERLTDAIARVKRNSDYLFAVLILDLDRFKIVNDTLGHEFGDLLLMAVASELRESIRPMDTVARLGGDEFAILLESIHSANDALDVAQRINQKLSQPFIIKDQKLLSNASIGIVLSSTAYEEIDEIIRDADIAMYRAKAKGRNCSEIFNPFIREEILIVSRIENELRTAIEQNELVVYYQPIVSLVSQQVVSFEALVRWEHPQRQLILPTEFISVAEKSQLIMDLDWWVLKTACSQIKTWQEQGKIDASIIISVNFSSKQFSRVNFIEDICNVLSESNLHPRNLRLEITESVLIENPDSALSIFTELQNLGITVSLDDFGTGYSSLGYLHRFPVNIIKIDRSFINYLNVDHKSLKIVQTILDLAKNLEIEVIAEGIETQPQLTLLQQLKCPYGQGYLFSQPQKNLFQSHI